MSVSFQLGSLTYFQITQKLIYKYIYSVVNQWICKYSFFFFFLGLYLWHMEVPRLGVQLKLQLPAAHSHSNIGSEPCQITAMPDL